MVSRSETTRTVTGKQMLRRGGGRDDIHQFAYGQAGLSVHFAKVRVQAALWNGLFSGRMVVKYGRGVWFHVKHVLRVGET